MTRPHPGGPASHLEDLRHELAGRGWTTSLLEPGGSRPRLFVQHPDPEASMLNEEVPAAPGTDGACWFWWPWASRIASTGDVSGAADRIAHVLRTAGGHPAGPA